MTVPVVALAPVTGRRVAGAYVALRFRAPQIAREARPGQFVNVVQLAPGHILRRPFSVAGVEGEEIEIVFDAIGEGTTWLARREVGESLDVIGPLGTAFSNLDAGVALLVGGGYGAAPVVWHSRELRAAGVKTRLILGARTASRLYECAPDVADEVSITTDDGSAGVRGLVTDVMSEAASRIYACGPMPMLAAVSAKAASLGVEAEVAVEEFMACGIGVCWTCVLPVRDNGSVHHARSCTEGPVFDAKVVAWQ